MIEPKYDTNPRTLKKCVARLRQGWGTGKKGDPEPTFNKICEIWEVDTEEAKKELEK